MSSLLETTLAYVSTTTAGNLTAGTHTTVDASSGAKAMTLPTPAHVGARVRVEKTDGSGNAVTVQGTIRGNTSGSIDILYQYESLEFEAESLTSWRPVNDRRSASALQAIVDSEVTNAVNTAVASAVSGTVIALTFSASSSPSRPDTSSTGQVVEWWGPSANQPPTTGTQSGGTFAAAPGDHLFLS